LGHGFKEEFGNFGTSVCLVSWIEGVDEFFIQRPEDIGLIDHVNSVLDKRFPEPEIWVKEIEPQPMDIVCAWWKNGFYRAEVISISLKALNVYEACVRLIDFGDTVCVPFSFLRTLPEELEVIPRLAIPCQIFDCRSVSEDCDFLFFELVYGKRVSLEVMSYSGQYIEVDLLLEVEEQPTSIRDALIYCDVATFNTDYDVEVPNSDHRFFTMSEEHLVPGSSHLVIMSDIRGSDEGPVIHVHWLSDTGTALKLPNLMSAMKKFYCVRKNLEMWGLKYMPAPGTPCAVVHLERGREVFYRGLVTKQRAGRMLEVLYVDFGNVECVPRYRVFRLFDKFLSLPALAVPVHLRGGEKLVGPYWVETLRDKIGLKDLELTIVEVCKDRSTVDLFAEGENVLTNTINLYSKKKAS